jgi:4-amino-4-deoxy-L-arabinose transferase-like glycosyltransferase
VSSARRAALLGILLLAAGLRVAGLGGGLRHPAHPDEGVFLDNAAVMVRSGDLDHRYYQYPGLLFYMLGPLVWLLSPGGDPPGPAAYLAARALVAAFGVAACALADRLGRELSGSRAGLLAALLLAVSPVAVETAHLLRPDVVLQAFTLAVLLALLRVGPGLAGDALAGVALGLAGAVKFSAVFLVPSYIARRLLVPGPRVRGMLVAGAAALGIFVVASPYAVLHVGDFVQGLHAQVAYHYQEARGLAPISYPRMVLFYLEVWPPALGLPAVLLCLLGLPFALRNARVWIPLLLLPVTATAVLATSDVRHDRFLLPALSVAFVLAGLGADRIAGPRRAAFVILAALAAAPPLLVSLEYLRGVVAPSTRDRTLDALAQAAPGSLVLSSVERLGLDPFRVEVQQVDGVGLSRRVQVLESDYVVSKEGDDPAALDGLQKVAEAVPVNPWNGPRITVWKVPASVRPARRRLRVDPGWVSASDAPADLPRAVDGRDDTAWTTDGVQRPGDWLQVTLPAPIRLDRVELDLGANGRLGARELKVLVSADGREFVEAPVRPGRPPLDEQRVDGKTHSQVFLLVPAAPARAFRLVLTRPGAHRWAVAELRVDALVE